LPKAIVSIVLFSFILERVIFCHSYPSKIPARPSVMAFPTTLPTIAPNRPNSSAPDKANIAKMPLSMIPKRSSERRICAGVLSSIRGRSEKMPRRIRIGPMSSLDVTKK